MQISPRRQKMLAIGLAILTAIAGVGAYYNTNYQKADVLPPLPEWADKLDGVIQSAESEFSQRVQARFHPGLYVPQMLDELRDGGFSPAWQKDGFYAWQRQDAIFPCLAERAVIWKENGGQIAEIRGTYQYTCP